VIFDGTGIYYDARQSVYQSVPIPQFPAASIVGNFAWRYNVYLTVNQNPESTVATLKTVLHGLKKKRIGLVVVNSSGGLGLVPVVKNLVVKGGGVWLGEQAQDLGAASFTSGAANLIAAKPDGIGIQDIDADAIVEDKGLRSAGYKGPIAANALASSFSTLQTLKDPEYFGQALTKPVVKTSIVYKAAQKFGNLKYVDQSTFATAWVSVYTAAAALKKCGFPCPTSKFENAANGMGSFSVPGGLLWGNLSVSAKKHNLTNTYGLDAWNPKKKAIVAEPYLISAGKP
jgi:ABC-type branched-subunit amino acid transport system substrate-binding protein